MRKHPLPAPAAFGLIALGCHRTPSPVARLDVQPRSLSLPSGYVTAIHLNWTPLRPLEGDSAALTVFVHLLDGQGKLLRTFDRAFPQPWTEGSTVSHDIRVYQSALAPPLAPA